MLGKKLQQRGDTIIEVLVVLAVLGLALSISYATANRSLRDTRQAQENSQATQIAQSQLELLRVLAPNGTSAPANQNIFSANNFCIHDAGGGNLTVVQQGVDPAFATNAGCTGVGQNGLYNISVTYCMGNGSCGAALSTADNFLVRVTWDDPKLGNGANTVTLTYRLHPPS